MDDTVFRGNKAYSQRRAVQQTGWDSLQSCRRRLFFSAFIRVVSANRVLFLICDCPKVEPTGLIKLYYLTTRDMDPLQLLDIVDTYLSEAEIREICRRFGVSFSAFPGYTKRDRTREFLGFIQRQGRMASLAEAIVALRPDLNAAIAQLFESKESELSWLDQVAGGEGMPLDSGLTWRWSASSGAGSIRKDTTNPPPTPDAVPPAASDEAEPQLPGSNTNPYTPGTVVSDPAMFFGRSAELAHVTGLLVNGSHAALIGGRSLGSSSLLRRVAGELDNADGRLVAVVDMTDPAHHTPAGLLDAIWTQWWGRVKPDNMVHVRTLAEFVTAVRKLTIAGFRPILLLDEFEQLVWRPSAFDDGLFDAWHELGREGAVTFALTAHFTPADLLKQGGYQSGFYELFQPVSLGLLDEPAARALLTEPIRAAGFNVPLGADEYLYLHAGPHPFFLHLAGYYLFDALAKSSYSRGEVIRQFEIAAEPYWQEMWESLSPLAQTHYPSSLIRVAEGMSGRQLRILANKGFIIADEVGYRPFSEGFARWLARMQVAMQAVEAATAASPV